MAKPHCIVENNGWKEIPSFPGYVASYDGSIAKVIGSSKRFPNREVRFRERKLQIQHGYLIVTLRVNGGSSTKLVHRLIAEAWIGTPPSGKNFCCHKDGDKQNNNVSNLRWDNNSGNMKDRTAHGNNPSGESCSRAKLTWSAVRKIRQSHDSSHRSTKRLSELYGVSKGAIRAMIRKETWWPEPIIETQVKVKNAEEVRVELVFEEVG